MSDKMTSTGSYPEPDESVDHTSISIVKNPTNFSKVTEIFHHSSQVISAQNASSWHINSSNNPIEIDDRYVVHPQKFSSPIASFYSPTIEINQTVRSTISDISLPPIESFYISCPQKRKAEEEYSCYCNCSATHHQSEHMLISLPSAVEVNLISNQCHFFQTLKIKSEEERFHKDHRYQVTPPLLPNPISLTATGQSNKPYLREHLHCVRYLKEDLHLPWGAVHYHFHQIFDRQPGFTERESEAALTSRSYRDNFIYASANGKPLLNYNGFPIKVQAKVRQRRSIDDKHIPFKLVEKNPSWAVKYSWVKPEHKVLAQAILDGVNPIYYTSKKDEHRRVIELAEQIEENLMQKSTSADLLESNDSNVLTPTPPVSPTSPLSATSSAPSILAPEHKENDHD